MNERPEQGITEADLHAFADGQLDPGRQTQVRRWLDDNPDEAAQVAAWQRQNQAIRAIYGRAAPATVPATDPGDAAMVAAAARQRRSRWPLAAAMVLLFLAGGGAGSLVTMSLERADAGDALALLPEASRTNYLVYAGEVRHPVEVGADEETHLVNWLGKRLGRTLIAPDLKRSGFDLVGGRLVPFDDRPGAMLMYENAAGERVTVLVGANPGHKGTGFRFTQDEGIRTFYWTDGSFGYALSGAVDRSTLQALARRIYDQYPTEAGVSS